MSSEKKFTTLIADDEFLEAVRAIASSYPNEVRLGPVRALGSLASPQNFPLLDPSLIEILKQVTVVIGTGSAAISFIKQLKELLSSSGLKAMIVDANTNQQITPQKL